MHVATKHQRAEAKQNIYTLWNFVCISCNSVYDLLSSLPQRDTAEANADLFASVQVHDIHKLG